MQEQPSPLNYKYLDLNYSFKCSSNCLAISCSSSQLYLSNLVYLMAFPTGICILFGNLESFSFAYVFMDQL